MPNPPNFSSWRHFHGVLIRTHNPLVEAYFAKLQKEDEESNRGKKTPSIRVIKQACLILVNDSAVVAAGKLTLFNSYLASRNAGLEADYYAIPIEDYHEKVQFKPQIVLLFRQRDRDVPSGRRPIEGQIGFRWRKESPSEIDAESLARKIDSVFGGKDSPYEWEKGVFICSYIDPPNGYRLKIYAKNEDEGRKVVEQVLQLQDDRFDEDFFAWSQSTRDFRSGREVDFIYGESRNLPRERPSGDVVFYRAELKIWGVRPDVTLVDYSGRRSDLLD
jgi:hypothetical protein